MTESQQVRGRHAGTPAPAGGRPQGQDDGLTDVQGRHEGSDQGHDQGDVQGQHVPGQVEPHHSAHGQSTASWTCVSIIMVGALVMAVAVIIATVWLFVVGAVVVVLGVISGKVLAAMGFGVSGRPGH
jgi:hypothetical protein